jgi:hypothetical protein
METLACLYYEVRSRFYKVSVDDYCDACFEVDLMARSLGYTLNDLAKILVIKD